MEYANRLGRADLILLVVALSMTSGAVGCSFDDGPLAARACGADSDCAEGYDCVDGYCLEPVQVFCTTDDDCDDGLFCNGAEFCNVDGEGAGIGGCLAGPPVQVDDDIDCTEDVCDEASGEVRHIRTADCVCADQDDAQACAAVAEARGLVCVVPSCNAQLGCDFPAAQPGTTCGEATGCRGQGQCTDQGACDAPVVDGGCDDGDACNGVEVCQEDGSCTPGDPVDVEDGVACTVGRCEDGEVTQDAGACECAVPGETCSCVGADCPDPDPCVSYVCSAQLECGVAQQNRLEAGASCDDGFACTDSDVCDDQGVCAGMPVDIACSNLDICDGEEVCDPTSEDSDREGCIDGVMPDISDGIDCTIDTCENNMILHTPDGCLPCDNDEECQPEEGRNRCLRYFCDDICMTEPQREGTVCDDGTGCTGVDVCDGNGQCTGTDPDDNFCIDLEYCDGLEICQPNHPEADPATGCRPGPSPELEDGVDCTNDDCVECQEADPNCELGRQGEIVHTPTEQCDCIEDVDCPVELCEVGQCNDVDYTCDALPADEGAECDDGLLCTSNETCDENQNCVPEIDACACQVDEDCVADDDNPCIASGSCSDGACVYTYEDEGVQCSQALCALASTCDGEGICQLVRNNGVCNQDCRENPRCDPENVEADEDGCVYDVGEEIVPEGPTGDPSCDDGEDNDCDGEADGNDSDCWTPEVVEVGGDESAVVGQPLTLTVRASNDNGGTTNQAANLYCVPRIESWFEGFESNAAINENDVLRRLGTDADVISGVEDDDVTGLLICNGGGLEMGPFRLPLPRADPSTYMIRVRMRSDNQTPLDEQDRLVLSFRNSLTGCRNENYSQCEAQEIEEHYVPMVAVDMLDTELLEYSFVVFSGNGIDPLTFRLELLATDGSADPSRCGFVDSVGLYEVPFFQFNRDNIDDLGDFPGWSYGEITEPSSMGFDDSDGDNRHDGVIETSFFTPFPEEGHTLRIEGRSDVTKGAQKKGFEWHYSEIGGIALPPVTEPPSDYDRSEPLRLQWSMSFNQGAQWSEGDGAFVGYTLDNNIRKLASVLPREIDGPYVTQYEAGNRRQVMMEVLGSHNLRHRYVVDLPEEMKPLLGRSIGFGTGGMSGSGSCGGRDPSAACLWIDNIDLHTRSHEGFVSVEVGDSVEPDSPVHEVTVTSQRSGRLRIECFWQMPGRADTPTIASAPHYVDVDE